MGPECMLVQVLGVGANCPPWVPGMASCTSLFARIWLSILIQACINSSNPVGSVFFFFFFFIVT